MGCGAGVGDEAAHGGAVEPRPPPAESCAGIPSHTQMPLQAASATKRKLGHAMPIGQATADLNVVAFFLGGCAAMTRSSQAAKEKILVSTMVKDTSQSQGCCPLTVTDVGYEDAIRTLDIVRAIEPCRVFEQDPTMLP